MSKQEDFKYINSFNAQIIHCVKNWQIWYYTAINDQIIRFRRTKLGNIWSALTNLITITLMCLIWSTIFNLKIKEFYPYLMNGFVLFLLINNSISESLTIVYDKFKQIYTNIPIPILSLVIRNIWGEIFNYLNFFPIIFIVFLLNGFDFIKLPIFILGLLILIINIVLICSILSVLTAKFRDLVPLVKSILSVSTLITPIFWKKEMLGEYQNYIYLNPLSFLIEIVRDPLIGKIPSLNIYIYALIFILLLYIINCFLFRFKGSRIIYWI